MIDLNQLEGEEELLASRALELFEQADSGKMRKPRFLGFLDERGCAVVCAAAGRAGWKDYLLFGGHSEAERQCVGVFPAYWEANTDEFPITPLTFSFRTVDTLSHRDFLGAILALGIRRETVGDILVDAGIAVVFVLSEMAPYILSQLSKVGRVGVNGEEGLPQELPSAHKTKSIEGTVSSERLDCILALLTRLSREKVSALLKAGNVRVNGEAVENASRHLEEGDRLSVKGFGRFRVDAFGMKTKKDRLHITCSQYI